MKNVRERQFQMMELENLHNIMFHIDDLFIRRAQDSSVEDVETMVLTIRDLQMDLIDLQYQLDPEVRQTVDELNKAYRDELAEIEWNRKHA